jgi:hypothetical protein
VRGGDLAERLYVGHLAEQVHGQQRPAARRDGRGRGLWVHRVRPRQHVGENRVGAGVQHAGCAGEERVRRTITSSPGPIPAARSMITSASLPLLHAIACRAPVRRSSAVSSSRTADPAVNSPRSTTSTSRVSIRGQSRAVVRAML